MNQHRRRQPTESTRDDVRLNACRREHRLALCMASRTEFWMRRDKVLARQLADHDGLHVRQTVPGRHGDQPILALQLIELNAICLHGGSKSPSSTSPRRSAAVCIALGISNRSSAVSGQRSLCAAMIARRVGVVPSSHTARGNPATIAEGRHDGFVGSIEIGDDAAGASPEHASRLGQMSAVLLRSNRSTPSSCSSAATSRNNADWATSSWSAARRNSIARLRRESS